MVDETMPEACDIKVIVSRGLLLCKAEPIIHLPKASNLQIQTWRRYTESIHVYQM